MTCDLTDPIFTNEDAAIAHMEHDRWPTGVICPLCGCDGPKKMGGKTQAGMFLCGDCRGKFTVRTGTIFERSHIPLHKWLLATHLMAASKKGISAHQLHRMLGITYKSAWFMAHRIREAMAPAKDEGPIGGDGKIVEADETFLTNSKRTRKRPGYQHKVAVLSLVERGGKQRSVVLKQAPSRPEIMQAIFDNVYSDSTLHTDGAQYYKGMAGLAVASHESVNHAAGEYARKSGNCSVHVNTLEGFF